MRLKSSAVYGHDAAKSLATCGAGGRAQSGPAFVAPPRGSKGRARTKVFREVSATIAQVRECSGSEPCSGPDGAGRQAMAQSESESMDEAALKTLVSSQKRRH